MSSAPRRFARAWLLVPLAALGFMAWTTQQRLARVEQVTHTDYEEAVVDPASPTGYAGGKRWLIVPEHNNRSYQWIAETQQMLAQRDWRIRQVDYDNAPFGRAVHAASPYRWWLGVVAWCDHVMSGRPPGLSVEHAVLWADPLLHFLLLAGAVTFAARRFGILAAALLAAGVAGLYPFAGGFLPGAPDERGLARICALWSVLPLLAAVVTPGSSAKNTARLFMAAGVAGGLGLWISAPTQVPVLAGLSVGGLLAVALGGKHETPPAHSLLPWRAWALAGAGTALAAYLIEYFPHHLEFHLEVNHPLYSLAWVGAGELFVAADAWRRTGKFSPPKDMPRLVLALAAIAALPVAMRLGETQSLIAGDLAATRLTSLPNGATAPNFPTWISRDGFTAPALAALLPLLVLVPALWLLLRRRTENSGRAAIALALGPVLVALPFAWRQLAWWNTCDTLLLALIAVTSAVIASAPIARAGRFVWPASVGLLLLPGLVQLLPAKTGENIELSRLEVEGLVERALAHWVADHAGTGPAVVLLPPDRTVSWSFHGGFRGIGTANWENRDGLAATVRIVTATTADEARGLINQRGITHIVLPSWDTDLDAFARWSLPNPEDAFIMALHHWALPPWLRPRPYALPVAPGFENQSVVILEVTGDSNRAVALSRLVEYFIETQQAERAVSSIAGLQRYPSDLSALLALAQVEKLRGNAAGFTQAFNALVTALNGGLDRTLAWDRRVSLAIVLALGERNDLAKEQVRRCLERLDEARLRSLTTGALFRLQVLGKAFDLPITDPALRELARKLLPSELRGRL